MAADRTDRRNKKIRKQKEKTERAISI